MTDRSITTSGSLDKHVRVYDYHSYCLVWVFPILLTGLILLGAALEGNLPCVVIVGSIMFLPFLEAYEFFCHIRLEITEDGLRYKNIFKTVNASWADVRKVTEGRTCTAGARCYACLCSTIFTDVGRFHVFGFLEPAGAPSRLKYLGVAATPYYQEVTEEIGRRANFQWTMGSDGLFHLDDPVNPTHERWVLLGRVPWARFGRMLVYSFFVLMVLISLWVILRG